MNNVQVLDTIAVSYLTSVPGYILFDVSKLIKSGYTGPLNLKIEYLKGEDVASIYIASNEDATTAKKPVLVITEPIVSTNFELNDGFRFYVTPTLVKNYFEIKGNENQQKLK